MSDIHSDNDSSSKGSSSQRTQPRSLAEQVSFSIAVLFLVTLIGSICYLWSSKGEPGSPNPVVTIKTDRRVLRAIPSSLRSHESRRRYSGISPGCS